MKNIVLITIYLSILSSCASFNNPREIKSEKHDGLKYESLERYDEVRLSNNLKLKDPIALCHANKFEDAHNILKGYAERQHQTIEGI